jgi:hypothetical protein
MARMWDETITAKDSVRMIAANRNGGRTRRVRADVPDWSSARVDLSSKIHLERQDFRL